ncbi:MAG: XRE family transcriptional regulator [Clostridia bacterium]|nr:XRE family transcriptional regulator [Clostridia bacterium]
MNIGASIRKIRVLSGLTQQEVADRCDLTKSMISKIENGRVVPAVGSLQRIARALGVTVSTLMEATENGGVHMTLNPFANPEGFTLTSKGYRIYPASSYPGQIMQPILVYAQKGELHPHEVVHQGEEFIHVIDGEMVFTVGGEHYLLRAGDSLYFDGMQKHGIHHVPSEVRYINLFAGYEFSGGSQDGMIPPTVRIITGDREP